MSKSPQPDSSRQLIDALEPLAGKIRLTMTLGPFVGFGAATAVVAFVLGQSAAVFLLSMAAGTFLGAGKLVVFAGAIDGAPLTPLMLAGLVVYSDLGTALVLISNMHKLYQVPLVGKKLVATRVAGHRVLKTHNWMRRASWLGLAVFVAVPFQGTGAVLGVFIGRILGLSRKSIVSAIAVGSTTGALALAAIGKSQHKNITEIANQPVLAGIVVVAVVAVAFLLGRWFLGNADNEDGG